MDDIKRIESELNTIRKRWIEMMSIDSYQVMLYLDFNQLANEVNDLKQELRIAKSRQ